MHGADYVWEDDFLVFGTYTVDLAGMTVPANFAFSTLAGANVVASNTCSVELTAANPNAYLYEIFLPAAAGFGDGDYDWLDDAEEAELGTNPADADSDGDGSGDGEEVLTNGTDPLDATSVPAPVANVTLTAYLCEVGFDSKFPEENCPVAAGSTAILALDASEFALTAEIDADGTALITDFGDGAYTLALDDVDGMVTRDQLNCFAANAPGVPEPRMIDLTALEGLAYDLELSADDVVSCRWVLYQDAAPTQAPVTIEAVYALPKTGTGASVLSTERGQSALAFTSAFRFLGFVSWRVTRRASASPPDTTPDVLYFPEDSGPCAHSHGPYCVRR